MSKSEELIADALRYTLTSPNVSDSNWENANVVDVLDKIALAILQHAQAVEQLADVLQEMYST